MSSILTNTTALTALQNLKMTQGSLASTQEQVSTGLKVGSAQDNSAYWSIAETMKSDNQALGAVSATLKQNASMLTNFASALSQAMSVVSKIKEDLVSITNTADAGKISQVQTDIIGQQNSLIQIISGAAFNGQNWLNGTVNGVSDANAMGTQKLTGAYTNSGGVAYISMLSSAINLVTAGGGSSSMTVTSAGGLLGTQVGGGAKQYSMVGQTAIAGTAGRVFLDSTSQQSDVDNMISAVAATYSKLETAGATIGAAQAQIDTQQNFVSNMQTQLSNGVSALVDADMNEVSTRLQALQTQQQLGVQSLSIANQSSQMILKLFQ